MILAILSLRWMFKNAKYKNLRENLYNKKKLALFPYFYNKEGTRPGSFVGDIGREWLCCFYIC